MKELTPNAHHHGCDCSESHQQSQDVDSRLLDLISQSGKKTADLPTPKTQPTSSETEKED
ncbi:MAG: hypothetical protein K2Z81_03345 [Cyanobacteria bacterium]|nr:hypothetical protein [Cyanobacteriota bacterium]